MSRQGGFDLSEFNPEAADFDLIVSATEILDISIRQIAREIASLVQPLTGLAAERIRNKLLGSQTRKVYIAARQTHTTYV